MHNAAIIPFHLGREITIVHQALDVDGQTGNISRHLAFQLVNLSKDHEHLLLCNKTLSRPTSARSLIQARLFFVTSLPGLLNPLARCWAMTTSMDRPPKRGSKEVANIFRNNNTVIYYYIYKLNVRNKDAYLHFALVKSGDGHLEGRKAEINESDVSRRLVGIGQVRRRAIQSVGHCRRARLVQQAQNLYDNSNSHEFHNKLLTQTKLIKLPEGLRCWQSLRVPSSAPR